MASCFDTDGEDDALGLPAARTTDETELAECPGCRRTCCPTTDETEPAGGADVEEPTARKNEEGNGEGNGEEERGGLQLRPRVALQYHRPDG